MAGQGIQWAPPPAGSEAERRLLGPPSPRRVYQGSIAAFLVGAVAIAIPYLALNLRDPGDENQTGLAISYAGTAMLGVGVALILGIAAWCFEPRWRGLLALLAGLAVGGIIGFLPVFLRGSASPVYDEVWELLRMAVGAAAVPATVGWAVLGAVFGRRRAIS